MILFSSLTSTTLRGWFSPTGIIELLERDISAGNEKLQRLPFEIIQKIHQADDKFRHVEFFQAEYECDTQKTYARHKIYLQK